MNRDVSVMCFIIFLFFLHAVDGHGRRARKTSSYFVFCLMHFIIYHGNLIIDSLRMPAYDHSSGHLSLMMGMRWRAAKRKRQFIMHRHKSPAHILVGQKQYAAGGARNRSKAEIERRVGGKEAGIALRTLYSNAEAKCIRYILIIHYTHLYCYHGRGPFLPF